MSLFPPVTSKNFDDHRNDAELWMPALGVIAERHRLEGALSLFSTGSAVVCSIGERYVVKLHEPWCRDLYTTEKLLLATLDGRLSIPTPGLIASGEIENWGYLVMRRLPGAPLSEVRGDLNVRELCDIAQCVGELVAETQALPVGDLDWPCTPWDDFIHAQKAGCLERHREHGVPEELLATLPDQLEGVDIDITTEEPVLLHTEWTDTNVLVDRVDGRWQLSGAFDFEPSMKGHPNYDLPSLTMFVARGDTQIARAALTGYGIHDPGERFRRNILAHTLLHRYSNLGSFLSLVGVQNYPDTWEEISAALAACPPRQSA